MNDQCYVLERLKVKSGIFDEIIDACYIIHLTGSNRLNNVLKQTYELPLCKNTMICHNRGYKKCKKTLKRNKSNIDLVDCNMYIFKDALRNGYQQICILEDDFIYEDSLFNPHHQKQIVSYLNKEKCKNSDYIYSLGSLPYLQFFSYNSLYHTNIFISTGTHATIYSKSAMNHLYKNRKNMDDIDAYLNMYYFYKRYGYSVPLITQTFPETENSKNWGEFMNLNMYNYIKYLFYLFDLHQSTYHYKTFFVCSILLFTIIYYFIIKKCKKLFLK